MFGDRQIERRFSSKTTCVNVLNLFLPLVVRVFVCSNGRLFHPDKANWGAPSKILVTLVTTDVVCIHVGFVVCSGD